AGIYVPSRLYVPRRRPETHAQNVRLSEMVIPCAETADARLYVYPQRSRTGDDKYREQRPGKERTGSKGYCGTGKKVRATYFSATSGHSASHTPAATGLCKIWSSAYCSGLSMRSSIACLSPRWALSHCTVQMQHRCQ